MSTNSTPIPALEPAISPHKIPTVTWLAYAIPSLQTNMNDALTQNIREVVANRNYEAEAKLQLAYQELNSLVS